MPSTEHAVPRGLEVWLRGTRAELDAARAALATVGPFAWVAPLQALHGADAGTFAAHVRITVGLTPAERARPARDRHLRSVPDPADLLVST